MKILDLSLTYKWYDMIASGEKKEEYREIKDYWIKRFIDIKAVKREQDVRNNMFISFWGFIPAPVSYDEGLKYFPKEHYDAVRFHRGQGGRQTMLIECKDISVGYGNPEWGAPADKEVIIIKLGNKYITQIPTSYEDETTSPIATRSRKAL